MDMDLETRIEVLPCGKCEDMLDCDTCIFSKEAKELYKQIREEVIAEISREMRLLYGNEYEQQIKSDAINDFVKAYENADNLDCTKCDRHEDFCCIKCFRDRYLKEMEQK